MLPAPRPAPARTLWVRGTGGRVESAYALGTPKWLRPARPGPVRASSIRCPVQWAELKWSGSHLQGPIRSERLVRDPINGPRALRRPDDDTPRRQGIEGRIHGPMPAGDPLSDGGLGE